MIMNTKVIGVKELRQNLASITQSAIRNKQKYLVLKNNTPAFELNPISKKDLGRAKFYASIERGRADIKAGRVYSAEDIEKEFGLK